MTFSHAMVSKGMQDGAGAWIKNVAARFILTGGHIHSAKDFFHFCEDHLTSSGASMTRPDRKN